MRRRKRHERLYGAYREKEMKPQTNADRIRQMTDEELASWLVHKIEGFGFDGYDERVNAWLDWLRTEVKT